MTAYLSHDYMLAIPADLLARLALALKQYRRGCWDPSYDDRLIRMETELDEAAERQLTSPIEDWLTVPQAAELIRCSERYARTLAPRLGGIKQGKAWTVPKDSVIRYLHKIPNTSGLLSEV